MEDCIFCKIVKGESPSYKVYEDDEFYGLLDIFPVTRGHSLLIPKKHFIWTHDVPEFGKYWEVARILAMAIKDGMNAKWVQYFTHGVIPHAHIHIIPRYEEAGTSGFLPNGKLDPPPTKEEMKKIAEKIRNALSG